MPLNSLCLHDRRSLVEQVSRLNISKPLKESLVQVCQSIQKASVGKYSIRGNTDIVSVNYRVFVADRVYAIKLSVYADGTIFGNAEERWRV